MRLVNPRERRLRALYARFASSPDGARIIAFCNAKKVHRLIKKLRPRRVLELGTGIGASAAFIADALPEGGVLTTLEQNEKYCRIARAYSRAPAEKNRNYFLAAARLYA